MANKHMKRCSTSLIIREMQIKTAMSISSDQSEWPSSKNLQTNAGECSEKGVTLHCWQECKLIQPLWRTVWRFLKKLGINPPYDSAIPLLGIYPEKATTLKDTCTPVFTAARSTIAGTWKQPRCPSTDEKGIIFEHVFSSGSFSNRQEKAYFIGAVAPSGPPSSESGTRSHLKCSPQLKPPRTTGDEL